MTREEIGKILNEWSAKRDSYPCPLLGKPCPKTQEGCRWYTPHIEGRIVGPNLPPLLSLDWICMFEQIFNQTGEALQKVQQSAMPRGPFFTKGIPGLNPPLGRGPN